MPAVLSLAKVPYDCLTVRQYDCGRVASPAKEILARIVLHVYRFEYMQTERVYIYSHTTYRIRSARASKGGEIVQSLRHRSVRTAVVLFLIAVRRLRLHPLHAYV
eukprot:COSAG05_NODE_1507_length_4689_cov_90.821569_5_plen_105_part_00